MKQPCSGLLLGAVLMSEGYADLAPALIWASWDCRRDSSAITYLTSCQLHYSGEHVTSGTLLRKHRRTGSHCGNCG